jgi:hypothetical protein
VRILNDCGTACLGMEVLESTAYVALGFVPMLAALEIAYRIGMKIKRRRKGIVVLNGILL